MHKGKIYRNRPIELQNNTWQSEQSMNKSIKRVMSNTQLSYLSPSRLLNNEDFLQEKEKQSIGKARQYVQKMQRRMNQRYNTLQKRYNSNLAEMEKIIDQKDLIIRQLQQALEQKQRIIQGYRRQNQEGLLSSRLMNFRNNFK